VSTEEPRAVDPATPRPRDVATAVPVDPATAVLERFASVTAHVTDNRQPYLLVPAALIVDVARFVRDHVEIRADALMSLSGLDLLKWPGAKKGEFPFSDLVMTYHLFSYRHARRLTLKVQVPRTAASVPTVTAIWPVAGQFEREIFDLYGVDFPGHPDLRRIMMPDDWVGHPLRKDYAYPTGYGGVVLKRDGQHFDDGPYADPALPKPAKPAAGGAA